MNKQSVKKALLLSGSQHHFQRTLTILISFSWVLLNFIFLGSTSNFVNPVFYCNQNYEEKIFEKQACANISKCKLIGSFTLTSELHLYCQNQWARDLIQSISPLGRIIGLFIINIISDIKSRKMAFMGSLIITTTGVLFALIGGWIHSITTIIIAQFIQGFGSSSIISLTYAYLKDYCSDQFKPRAVVFVNTAWSVSTILLGVFYLIELPWYVFLFFVILLPLIALTIFFHFYLLESPYILMLQNKRQQTLQILKKIAKINKREQNIPEIESMINSDINQNVKNKASVENVLKILSQWQYLKPIIILSVICFVGTINFSGTSYAFGVEGLGLGYNSMIAGFLEIISFLVLTIYINRIPRRIGIAGFYLIAVVLSFTFLFPQIKKNFLLATILIGILRIFETISYTLIASVQTEIFTNEIQSTAVGISEVFGRIASICAPLIVDLGDKIGVDPIFLTTILLVFGILSLLLKETLNRQKNKQIKQISYEEVYCIFDCFNSSEKSEDQSQEDSDQFDQIQEKQKYIKFSDQRN